MRLCYAQKSLWSGWYSTRCFTALVYPNRVESSLCICCMFSLPASNIQVLCCNFVPKVSAAALWQKITAFSGCGNLTPYFPQVQYINIHFFVVVFYFCASFQECYPLKLEDQELVLMGKFCPYPFLTISCCFSAT